MRTRQKCVATDTWRSLGCRTTPLEHWSRRKPTVEPRWAKQQTKKLRPKPTKINSFKYKKDRIKSNREKVDSPFPHYKSKGAFCCHGHQSFDPICLKTLCSFSPPPVMLHIKFDQEWPTGLRDIQVRKCEIFVIQGQVTSK